MTGFADLAVITNFSFLRGASHPEELVGQAYALGHAGIGIADRNSLAGVVRAYSFVKERVPAEAGFRLAVGARGSSSRTGRPTSWPIRGTAPPMGG